MSLKSKKVFVDGRTYGRLRPTLLGRLGVVDLKIAAIKDSSSNFIRYLDSSVFFGNEGASAGENKREMVGRECQGRVVRRNAGEGETVRGETIKRGTEH